MASRNRDKGCAIDSCREPAAGQLARLCQQHYHELYRFKDKYADAFTSEIYARFDSSYRTDDAGCWVWTESRDKAGFPLFKTRSRYWIAFRYSYLRYLGDLKRQKLVLHTCRNVLCVNPAHLYVKQEQQLPAEPSPVHARDGVED